MRDIRSARTVPRLVSIRCAPDAGMLCTLPPDDVGGAHFHPMDIAVDSTPTWVLAMVGSTLHSMQPEQEAQWSPPCPDECAHEAAEVGPLVTVR